MGRQVVNCVFESNQNCGSKASPAVDRSGLSGLNLYFSAVQLGLQPFDFLQQLCKLLTEIGEAILDPRRDLGKLNPLEDSRAGEMTEAVGQDFCANAFDVPF